jgi:hypothetical protein
VPLIKKTGIVARMRDVRLAAAREAMTDARARLDDYIKNRTANITEFERLYKAMQDSTAKYADLVRKRMKEKYSHLTRTEMTLLNFLGLAYLLF